MIDEFTDIVKQAFREFLNDKIAIRLQSAIDSTTGSDEDQDEDPADDAQADTVDDGIETTVEELDGYFIVKSILRESIDPARVTIRDVRSYCGILLDDNNRQPICRCISTGHRSTSGLFHGDKGRARSLGQCRQHLPMCQRTHSHCRQVSAGRIEVWTRSTTNGH